MPRVALLLVLTACTKDMAAPPEDSHVAPPEGVPQMSFVDASGAAGIAHCVEFYGFAVADYDRDQSLDLAMSCGEHEPMRLLHGVGNVMQEQSSALNQSGEAQFSDRRVPAFGDVDGDGKLGLFVPTGGGDGFGAFLDQLYRNSDGVWTDVAADYNLQDPYGGARYGVWFDIDGDSDDDLFVGHRIYPGVPGRDAHTLYANGPWTDVAEDLGFGVDPQSSGAGLAADWDGDDDLDLLLSARCVGAAADCSDDPTSTPRYYENRGAFVAHDCAPLGQLVTAVSGDIDGDGDEDLALGRVGEEAALALNPGDGSPPCVWPLRSLGVNSTDATAVALADFDNDGTADLFIGRTNPDGAASAQWLRGVGATDFEPLGRTGPELWAANGRVFAAPLDLDGDGWMDLLIGAEEVGEAPTMHLFRNELGDIGSPSSGYTFWLLDSRGGGSTAGAAVSVGDRWARESAGGGWRTATRTPLHIGVGDATPAAVTVRWPDGTEQAMGELEPGCYVLRAAEGSANPC